MALFSRLLLKRVLGKSVNSLSTAPAPAQNLEESIKPFRTIENDPVKHNINHLNRFYTLSPEDVERLYFYGGLPTRFQLQCKAFVETSILIREPAIEIISYLEQTDYSKPVNRYMLYGDRGTGKSLILAHLLHYGFSKQKLLVHVPWVPDWYQRRSEKVQNSFQEKLWDLPLMGARWLLHFKHQNLVLLSQLNLKTTKDYEWNLREKNSAGSSLIELIDFGISRAKYTCDVVRVLLDEIKLASIAGKCNTLVIMDGFNAFFANKTRHAHEAKRLSEDSFTLTQPFLDIVQYNWCNGAVILSVDKLANYKDEELIESKCMYPRYLLGKRGFEIVDPFLPVFVPDYNIDEFNATMDYFKDRKWIRDVSKGGIRELELLSNKNPYDLMRYVAPL